MIASFSRALAAVAAIGWALSFAMSIAGFVGLSVPQSLTGTVFVGLFPLWLCAVVLAGRATRGVSQVDFWKAALRGCPDWLRYAIWSSWAYTFLMFALMALGANREAAGAGFVGVFYASALGIFITNATTTKEPSECSNGHKVGPFDKFCRECGSEIKRNSVELVS
ncbi:MAG TPA: hypothetical protein VM915_01310 [Verrucomicrobiae bacterium]|nr:hypothetical protein [Verrucomicrobiae bacterium]